MSAEIKNEIAKFDLLIAKATAADAKVIIEALKLQTVVMSAILINIEHNTGAADRAQEAMRRTQSMKHDYR